MRIEASAPGKLVLLGEYAVLEGIPALVLAVNRRARVTLTPASGGTWEIISPTRGASAHLHVGPSGCAWEGEPPPELAWLATLFSPFHDVTQLPPCRVELDSDPFYLDHAGARVKLGLGSSAALTVALLGALHQLAGRTVPTLAECVRAHREIQHGRGSGIDIAASLAGGLSRFQLDARHAPRSDPFTLPGGLHWRCAYSGSPASTSAMLATVAAWRAREPAGYARHMGELATIAECGVAAVAKHDAAAFLSSLHVYALALAHFGEACGVDIASRPHRDLAAIAAACGVVYKSCGAGGGDVGITFGVDDRSLREFTACATRAGFPVIELAADPSGLEVMRTV